MQKYQSIITATNGSVIRNVPVTVLKEDGGLADLFMDREGHVQAPNPLVTDSRGVFYFYAKNGRYSLRTAADGVQITDADTVLLFDPDETATDGPIADAVRRAEDAAERAETALSDSGLQNMVQDAQDASANAAQAVIEANLAVASIDAALIAANQAKTDAQSAAQTASEAAIDAQAVKDSLLNYDGALSTTPEWSSVPAHVDLNLDTQAQALANRSELLRDNQKRTPLHFATLAEASAAAATLPDGQVVEAVVNDATLQYVVSAGSLVKIPARAGDGPLNVRQFITSNIDGVTSNQSGVVAAVASALLTGAELYWPAGVYVSTDNIPNLHEVSHKGNGVIKRGSNIFLISPKLITEENNLYVSADGVSTNDGLTPDKPMLLSSAKSALENAAVRASEGGSWVVNLAAGTYNTSSSYNLLFEYLPTKYPLTFKGPSVGGHPNLPAVVIDGVGGRGWQFSRGMYVLVRDVKFKGFVTGSGLIGSFNTTLATSNVHTEGCRRGVWASSDCILVVPDGIFDGLGTSGGYGIYSYNRVYHTIGNPGVTDNNLLPIIKNYSTGFYAAEVATGHANAVIEDCVIGYDIASCSRVNADHSNFKRCTTGIRASQNSVLIGLPTELNFNLGTADATVTPIVYRSGGADGVNSGTDRQGAVSKVDYANVTVAGTTSETFAKSYFWAANRVPSGAANTIAKCVEIYAAGNKTGTNGGFSAIVRMHSNASTGGTQLAGTSVIETSAGAWEFKARLYLTSPNTQSSTSSVSVNGGVNRIGIRNTSLQLNDGVDRYINFNIIPANSADSISVEFFDVRVW